MKGLGVGDIGPVALSVMVAVIIVGVGAMILATMQDNVTEGNASELISEGLTAVNLFGDWFNIIVIVVISVILLGLVFLLQGRKGGRA